MPRPRKVVPEMKCHISGQARVYLDGQYYYLGPHGTAEARAQTPCDWKWNLWNATSTIARKGGLSYRTDPNATSLAFGLVGQTDQLVR
jgi:hypothetical protein